MESLKEPLLSVPQDVDKLVKGEDPVTGYADAGFISRGVFWWLNPILQKGSKKSIDKEDVPLVAPQDRASELYKRFDGNWPTDRKPNTIRSTLIKTLWPMLLRSACLAMCKLAVLFVGPVMIQSFATVTSAKQRYALVVLLILSKLVEVFTNHQYNFSNKLLAMQVRSTMITAVYRKGLRLSNGSRQSHGVGRIVNYMSVDVQNLADLITYLNNLWTVPLQAVIGGTVMFLVVGVSAFAGLFVMAIIAWLEYIAAIWLRGMQQNIAKSRDLRTKAIVEALANIKIIKLQAWDGQFLKNVESARTAEFASLSRFTYTVACSIFVAWLAPLVSCAAIFACTIILGPGLTPAKGFTTIATLRVMQELLRSFPNTLLAMSQALISLDRLEDFMWSDELDSASITNLSVDPDADAISVENGSFKWDPESPSPTLQDINLRIKRGSLVAVVGKVGSGKTSLLAALQGEITKITGKVHTMGSTACVAQTAWVQNATIQDNILFGRGLEKNRYYDTLKRCSLLPDLAHMESMDQTEIGEKGVNLSGGQKQRIQLARALYHDADMYFLDDIFSAVDAHTGSQLFREVVLGAFKDKTVLLVTHQIEFLPQVDLILVMRDGRIVQSGRYEELLSSGTDFEALVDAYNEALRKVSQSRGRSITNAQSHQADISLLNKSTTAIWHVGKNTLSHQSSHHDSDGEEDDGVETKDEKKKTKRSRGRLINEEMRETGCVSWSIYWLYFTEAYGGALVITLLFVQTIWQVLQILGDFWMAYGLQEDYEARIFIYVYTWLALSCGFCVIVRSLMVGFLGLTTAQRFFTKMTYSIFCAPISFFDTTPCGRILSRATTDQSTIDYILPIMFGAVLAVIFQILGMLVVTCRISLHFIILLFPLAYIYRTYQAYYFKTSCELTRMDGITKAPIIHHFSETIAGFVTIRCFKQQYRFMEMNMNYVDSNIKMEFHSNAAMEWVGLRVELIGVLVLLLSLLFIILIPSKITDQEMMGLSLTYGLSLNQYLFDLVSLSCSLENKMISVERIGQYMKLSSEAELTKAETQLPPNWPTTGNVVLQDLKLRYRACTPLVLKGINVTIQSGTKVGIVGKTGSGKSTLLMALFRLVEPTGGRILIDNVDISTIGLHDLRSKLNIIPQEPTLFDGTVRSNLDLLGEHKDIIIWEALDKCQLAYLVRQLPRKLHEPVESNGENWSLGQRQLFCLARVLLMRAKVLVLDEATSSIDAQTDAIIQKIVQQEFSDCTVINIAHRIPTIMDSDKVIVLDKGLVREYDSPKTLLDQPNSLFSALVHEYTIRSTH